MFDLYDIFNQVVLFLIVVLSTFGISSMWLYSELFREIREYVLSFYESKYWILHKISFLAICQLCCSFWISLVIQYYIFEYSLVLNFLLATGVAGISWALGTCTKATMYLGAIAEADLTRSLE